MSYTTIKNKKQFELYMARFSKLFHAKARTREGDEADLLALLIKDYEDRHFVMNKPTPLEAIQYRMEQGGLTRNDLAKILGYKSRVSDIFNKQRKLNLSMVRKLYKELHIPLETLIKEY
jgi:HTH-type transcriptional regulator/antitoxin HigA